MNGKIQFFSQFGHDKYGALRLTHIESSSNLELSRPIPYFKGNSFSENSQTVKIKVKFVQKTRLKIHSKAMTSIIQKIISTENYFLAFLKLWLRIWVEMQIFESRWTEKQKSFSRNPKKRTAKDQKNQHELLIPIKYVWLSGL